VNVPAGKTTFMASLFRDRVTGRGKMHLADIGYKNARWGMARIMIENADEFTVLWTTVERSSQLLRRYYFPLHFVRKTTPMTEEEEMKAAEQLREQENHQQPPPFFTL
jgi:hypothetical protein